MSVRSCTAWRRTASFFLLVVTNFSAGSFAGEAPPPRAVKVEHAKSFTQTIPGTEISFEMLPIPGGRFSMGSPPGEKDRRPDEGPQVEVEVDPFFMGRHEVTWDAFNEYIDGWMRLTRNVPPKIPADRMADAVTYPTPKNEQEFGPALHRMGGQNGKYPAVLMSQFTAKQFTKWLSKKTGRFYRLPTEAEWEYACRAGTNTAFSFGDDVKQLDDFGWHFDNSMLQDQDPAYRQVGRKKPNPWGLYDMHGNVAEWCIDAYSPDWYERLAARGGVVKWQDAVNWPTQLYPRVVRGGNYEWDPEDCRSAWRYGVTSAENKADPESPKSPFWLANAYWIGFRLVSPTVEPTEQEKLRYWDVDDEQTKATLFKHRADRQVREIITPPERPAGAQPDPAAE
jgi:formylglycine-generating enzyme required for sulfatase activity